MTRKKIRVVRSLQFIDILDVLVFSFFFFLFRFVLFFVCAQARARAVLFFFNDEETRKSFITLLEKQQRVNHERTYFIGRANTENAYS